MRLSVHLRLAFLLSLAVISFTVSARGQAALDTVVFGDASSETAHALAATYSATVASGSLSQPYRYLTPANPAGVNGGDITVTMTVDPAQRNYFTLKLWGGDDTNYDIGRLYLYVPLNGVNYQMGYRHEGDYMPLSVTAGKPPLPGRFFYSTTLLPLWMTKGKTSLTLRIVSTGKLYGLGSGGPPSGNYQYNMTVNSRGIYRAYTHTQPMLDVSGETQGSAPVATTRPAVTESSILGASGTYTKGLNTWVNGRLSAGATTFNAISVQYLAEAYFTPKVTAAYGQAAIVNKVVAVIDGFAADYYNNPATSVAGTSGYGDDPGNEVWGGRFGPLGWAVHLLQSQLAYQLDATASYGAGGTLTRRTAWGDMLAASRDYGRFNRRTITNQTILANQNIYKANRGLLALGDARAFTDTDAQRYLKEAVGLLPWLGDDLPSGGSTLKYGSQYYQTTPKGMTREWGYVGGYGEMAHHAATFYSLTGNTAFRDQAVKMLKARAPFRRPSFELSGANTYRTMERTGLLAWRGVRECDGDFSNEINYGEPASWSNGMHVAGLSLDPAVVGYAKQMLADNQYLNNLVADSRYYSSLTFDSQGAFEVFADYDAVKAATDSGTRLPMTDGQPDFVWADEVSGVVALKRGSERMWVAPFWQAKGGTGINGIARFHYSTATYDHYGVFETTPQFRSKAYFTRPNYVDRPDATGYAPPDNPSNAYAGEKLPLGIAPSDAADGTPYRGRVDFYAFRFGHYLFGLNATTDRSYELKTPIGFSSATDLVSNTAMSGTVTVAPTSSVVLYLATAADAAPVPTAPLLLTAAGSSAPSVALSWSASSGASTYTVRRATVSGGPYVALANATNLSATSYTDTSVSAGSVYYYVVSAANANGTSYDSMEAGASAGLPSPWSATDVGTVGVAGSSSLVDDSFALSGTGSNIGTNADSFHFASVPVTGNGTLIARVASRVIAGTVDDKVGLMIREDTATGSRNFSLFMDALYADVVRATYRASTNGSTTGLTDGPNIILPEWLKVERVGNTFAGYCSSDGVNWTAVGSTVTISMASTVRFGLFVCARDSSILDTTVFDGVVIPGVWSQPPAAPSGLTAASPRWGAADLSWSAAKGAVSYRVKRSLLAGGPYQTVATVNGTSFTDSGLAAETTWFYVISALNAGGGESPDSAETFTTTIQNEQGSWSLPAATAKPDVTTAAGNATLTLSANPFAIGDLVQVVTAFSGFTASRYYWVVASSGLTVQLSATKGGAAIAPVASGTATAALRSSQSWNTAANWDNATVAHGRDATATFPVGSPALEVAAVVVDADTTLGRLLYTNTSSVSDFTLASGPDHTLTFGVTGTVAGLEQPLIEVPQATNRRLNLGERDNATLRIGGNQGLIIRSSAGGAVSAGLGSQPAKEVTLFNPDWSAFTGGLIVDRGVLNVQLANKLPVQSHTLGTDFSLTNNVLAGLNLVAAQSVDGLNGNANGRVYGAQTLTVGAAGGDGAFAGIVGQQFNGIRTATNLIKAGGGRQDLSGAMTGNGTTTLNAGALVFSGASDFSGAISVNSGGTLLVNGSLSPAPPIASVNLAGTSGSSSFTSSLALKTGDQVRITTANAGLSLGTVYYVVNTPSASTTVKVSATSGGAALTATASATAVAQFLNAATGTSGRLVAAAGSTLGGTGTLAPFDTAGDSTTALSVAGLLAPGDPLTNGGIGTLTFNGSRGTRQLCALETGATLRFQLASGTRDTLALVSAQAGDLVFNANVIDFVDTTGGALPTGDYALITSDAAGAFSGLTTDANTLITAGLSIGTGLEAYPAKSLKLTGNSIVLSLRAYTARELWRLARFGTAANQGTAADDADPDGDGRANLLEYALNTDPLVANSGTPTTPAVVGSNLTLTFQRIADPLLIYEVWASNDLISWGASPIWTSTGTSNVAGPVTVTDSAPLGTGRRFLRLQVHE